MKKILVMSLVALFAFASVSCGIKTQDTEDSLEVYCLEAGYGTEWCTQSLEAFKQEAWVKEKYPNLKTHFTSNDLGTFAISKLNAGGKNNTIDLFFTANPFELVEKDSNGVDKVAELTDTVYNKTVPGENITYLEKTNPAYLESCKFAPRDGSELTEYKSYLTSWANSRNGILYNADILNQLGMEVPLTTNEFGKTLADIKALAGNKNGKYDKGYGIICSSEAEYMDHIFNIWWAQYQSKQGYIDFQKGKVGQRITKDIFKQMGRLEALKIFENLFSYNKGYVYQSAGLIDYITAQTMFLQGEGVFMANGDWFDSEMKSIKQDIKDEEGKDYNIKFMKTPILSAVVDKCDSIKELATSKGISNDAALALVVKAVDAGETTLDGVTEDDFNFILEARRYSHSIGPNHAAFIPNYAIAKGVAQDFLLFLATDKANEIFAEATYGGSLPFKFNLEEKAPDVYNSLGTVQKSRLEIENDAVGEDVLPCTQIYPLVRYASLLPFHERRLFNMFTSSNNTLTAQNVYDKTIEVWTDSKWSLALETAGIIA